LVLRRELRQSFLGVGLKLYAICFQRMINNCACLVGSDSDSWFWSASISVHLIGPADPAALFLDEASTARDLLRLALKRIVSGLNRATHGKKESVRGKRAALSLYNETPQTFAPKDDPSAHSSGEHCAPPRLAKTRSRFLLCRARTLFRNVLS
jgi:hypothetical protein